LTCRLLNISFKKKPGR